MQHNVILIGFMGTGKSTVGRLLAERLSWSFVDMDERIARRAGQSISDIFARRGESEFRRLESDVLTDLLQAERQVIATGGGAVLAVENRAAMAGGGFVVALTASREAIIARVSGDTERPLLAGDVVERVDSLLLARRSAYDFAHLTIDTTQLDPLAIVQEIVNRLEANG